jgi:hypothetical protein
MSPMLVCRTELESPAWRLGMIDALTMGHSRADCEGLRGGRLYLTLLRRFTELAPPAYRRYRRIQTLLGDAYRIYPERLSFWQWRTCAVGLTETTSLDTLLGRATLDRTARVRHSLLFTTSATENLDEDLSEASHACGHVCDPVPNEIDGQIDGYLLCARLMYDDGLDGERFVDAIAEYLEVLWPADYRRYRCRYAQHICQARMSHPESRWEDIGPCLEYRLWSVLVGELHAEVGHCRRAGVKPSRTQWDLRRILLCQPGEPLPVLDWTLPPAVLARSSW